MVPSVAERLSLGSNVLPEQVDTITEVRQPEDRPNGKGGRER